MAVHGAMISSLPVGCHRVGTVEVAAGRPFVVGDVADPRADEHEGAVPVGEASHDTRACFASMFVRQVRQCFSVVWADGFPRCRHRFPVM